MKKATKNNQHEKLITSTEISRFRSIRSKLKKEREKEGERERERGVLTGINGKKEKAKKQVEQEMSV